MRVPIGRPKLAAALAALAISLGGCGWVEKTAECFELSSLSRRWSQEAESFSTQLEADLERNLKSLDRFDTSSKQGFVRASHDLREASDALDGQIGPFLEGFSNDFRAIPLSDPTLVEFRGRYVAQIEDLGSGLGELTATVRRLGDLFARIDPSRITTSYQARSIEQQATRAEAEIAAAQHKLDEVTKAEEALIDGINAYCHLLVPPGEPPTAAL